MSLLRMYLIALAIFLVLDAIWLGFVGRNFYRDQIGYLLAEKPNWWAAGIFYLIFVGGMVVFVIWPSSEADSLARAVAFGAFFGFVTYATYDLTNLATIAKWPVTVTIVDLIWGSVLSAVVCTTTVWLNRFITGSAT